jgi:hypothetical protein
MKVGVAGLGRVLRGRADIRDTLTETMFEAFTYD